MERPAKAQKTSGVSPPISVASPEPVDIRRSEALRAALSLEGVGQADLNVQLVRERLQALLTTFIHDLAISQGLTEEQAANAGGKILTLGSQALDSATPGADVDLLCVVPYFVEHSHFFADSGLGGLLRDCDEIEDLHPVPDAFVPVIKFVLYGVHVDLLVTRLRLPQIPADLSPLQDKLLLRCVNETDVNAVNGVRVAAAIMSLVPHKDNFRTTLQAVKLWSQRRGINHNQLGFPGGVAWAMLTARVCQLYPNAAPSTLLSRFFSTWSQWKFGEVSLPVLLHASDALGGYVTSPRLRSAKLIHRLGALSSGNVELPSHIAALDWNPQNARDRTYVMQVITPCRPRICATHSVCKSTLAVLKAELALASSVISSLNSRNAEASDEPWTEIFEPIDFFSYYKGYMIVELTADNDEQLLHWCGWVKSRLRRLTVALERTPGVDTVHPLPWPLAVRCNSSQGEASTPASSKCISFFIGLGFVRSAGEQVNGARQLDLRPPAKDFIASLLAWKTKGELCNSADVLISFSRDHDLPAGLLLGPLALPFAYKQDRVSVCGVAETEDKERLTASGEESGPVLHISSTPLT